MKILHVIENISARFGGPATALRALAREQARVGNKVVVCTTNRDYPVGEMSVPTGVPLPNDGFTIWYHQTQWSLFLFSEALFLWVNKFIKSFDVVHIHGLYRFPVTYSAWRARRAHAPYLISPHGSLDPFLYRQSRYGKWAVPLKRIYEHLFDIPNLNHAGAIHYTAQEEAERAAFLRLRAKRIVVPIGIDWESFRELPVKGFFRRRLGIKEGTPLVLFLGRINFKKGLDLLVPAFSHVLREEPRGRLAIVGPDNEGYRLKVKRWCREQGVEDEVFFVDHLGPEDVKRAYLDADVFVLPSYTENFGMTVVEAMACGCPVVISDQVNIWREVQEAGAGIVVGLDPGQIARAICRVLGNKGEARAMGARGRQAAKERYAWPRIVEQLTRVYEELIEEAGAKRRSGK